MCASLRDWHLPKVLNLRPPTLAHIRRRNRTIHPLRSASQCRSRSVAWWDYKTHLERKLRYENLKLIWVNWWPKHIKATRQTYMWSWKEPIVYVYGDWFCCHSYLNFCSGFNPTCQSSPRFDFFLWVIFPPKIAFCIFLSFRVLESEETISPHTVTFHLSPHAFAGMKSGEGGRSRMKSVCVSAWSKWDDLTR